MSASICVLLLLTVAIACGLWIHLRAGRGAPTGEFLLLSVEARTVFDAPHLSSPDPLHPQWTGETLISPPSILDRVAPPRVRVLYQVKSPEDVSAVRLHSVRRLPATLSFPTTRSNFARVVLLLRHMRDRGEVSLELSGHSFALEPSGEERIGLVREASGGLTAYCDPEQWRERLEEALARGEPAAVFVVRNEGWVRHDRVKSPEEVLR
ncbi:MAG: hypothetical protein R6U70_11550 [Bacillota bacterium]